MSKKISLVITEQVLASAADEESLKNLNHYHERGRKEKRAYVVSGVVQEQGTYQVQKLIYSYARELFELAMTKKLFPINDFSFFKLKLSAKYLLGKFTKKIILVKQKGKEHYRSLEKCFERWSWSYLNSSKKQLRTILEALGDFGEQHLAYPLSLFALGRIDNVKEYLIKVQLNKCAISRGHLTYPCDLHHAYLHNTSFNRSKFPHLINSIVNLYAVKHDEHIINHPHEEECYTKFMTKLKARQVSPLLRQTYKEQTWNG